MSNNREYFSDIETPNQKKTFFPHKRGVNHQADESCTPKVMCRGLCRKIKIPVFIGLIIVVAVGFILTNNAIDYTYRYAFEINMSSVRLSNDVEDLQETVEKQQMMIMYLYEVLDDQGVIKTIPDVILNEYQKYLSNEEQEQEPTTSNDINDGDCDGCDNQENDQEQQQEKEEKDQD